MDARSGQKKTFTGCRKDRARHPTHPAGANVDDPFGAGLPDEPAGLDRHTSYLVDLLWVLLQVLKVSPLGLQVCKRGRDVVLGRLARESDRLQAGDERLKGRR